MRESKLVLQHEHRLLIYFDNIYILKIFKSLKISLCLKEPSIFHWYCKLFLSQYKGLQLLSAWSKHVFRNAYIFYYSNNNTFHSFIFFSFLFYPSLIKDERRRPKYGKLLVSLFSCFVKKIMTAYAALFMFWSLFFVCSVATQTRWEVQIFPVKCFGLNKNSLAKLLLTK